MMNPHENIVLKSYVVLSESYSKDVMELGKELLELGADNITDSGFWIWDVRNNIEFYSPLFRNSLGFENEEDFINIPESWMKQIEPKDLDLAIENYNSTINGTGSYYQNVTYSKKNGEKTRFICSGTLIKGKDKKPLFLIGTHKKIN